jgi:hypothetical protein
METKELMVKGGKETMAKPAAEAMVRDGYPRRRFPKCSGRLRRAETDTPCRLAVRSAAGNVCTPLKKGGVEGTGDVFLDRVQVDRLARWKMPNRVLVRRAWLGKCSPRQAIKANCLDCVNEECKEIAECGDRCCPLWRFRPYQRKG